MFVYTNQRRQRRRFSLDTHDYDDTAVCLLYKDVTLIRWQIKERNSKRIEQSREHREIRVEEMFELHLDSTEEKKENRSKSKRLQCQMEMYWRCFFINLSLSLPFISWWSSWISFGIVLTLSCNHFIQIWDLLRLEGNFCTVWMI